MKNILKAVVMIFIMTAVINNNYAQPVIPYSVIASGGSVTTDGNNRIIGTIGQSFIGITGNGLNINEVGFWYITKQIVTSVEEEENEIPLIYELKQNYPNPFNPSTIIQFSIVEQAFTEIKIYDILGSEVAKLVSEELQPGIYELNFTANHLASGVYIYRMTSGKFGDVKKMNLVK